VAAVEAIRSFEAEVASREPHPTRGASSIAVVSEEAYPPYARHLISYYLTGEREGDLLSYRPADFWAQNGVQAYPGYQVVSLDTGAREVRLRQVARPRALPVGLPDDGPAGATAGQAAGDAAGEAAEMVIGYETLLLATGGYPIMPPLADPGARAQGQLQVQGSGQKPAGKADGSGSGGLVQQGLAQGLSFFTTLDDAIRVRRAVARGARKAVVIGGGLIGLQVAEALVRLGVRVEIVELMPRLLGPVLDEEGAARVEALARRAGVGVWTGVSATAVERDDAGRLTGVVLADGRRLAADLVILAVGVRPRLELARAAGLLCDRGVVMVRGAETSIPGVFAAGDVAQGWDMAAEALRPLPIWSNAVFQGRMAGRQMAARVLGIDSAGSLATGSLAAGPSAVKPEFAGVVTRADGSAASSTDGSAASSTGGNGEQGHPFAGLMLNAAHFFGLSVVSAGLPNPPAGDDRFTVVTWQRESSRRPGRSERLQGLEWSQGSEWLQGSEWSQRSEWPQRAGGQGRPGWQGRATPDRSGVMQRLAQGGWDYRKLVFRDGRLVGLLAAGPSVAGAGAIAGLIRRGVSIDEHTTGEALVRKWDWSVLPRSLREELLWEQA